MTYQVPPPDHGENWFRRNRRWFIPTAIVSGILLITAMALAFVLVIFAVLRNSQPAAWRSIRRERMNE